MLAFFGVVFLATRFTEDLVELLVIDRLVTQPSDDAAPGMAERPGRIALAFVLQSALHHFFQKDGPAIPKLPTIENAVKERRAC